MKLASGHEVVALEGEELERHEKHWQGHTEGLVRLMPGRIIVPATYTNLADNIYNFKLHEDDVMVVTWPKCGTTWVQEVVWTMRNNPDLNHPMAAAPINARIPFLEFDMLMKSKKMKPPGPDHPLMQGFRKACPGRDPANGIFLQMGEMAPAPRTLKSHLPLSLLPPTLLDTAKVVYIARNPKDVVVSFLHHARIFLNHSFTGDLDDFLEYFVNDDLIYGPYWRHLKEAWTRRDSPNLHFIFYEDLKTDNMAELAKLDAFLGTKLTQDQLTAVAKYTSFGEMKSRNLLGASGPEVFHMDVLEKDGGFFRKGEVGDWRSRLTKEQEARVDAWAKEHLNEFGIDFKYGL